ncbi:MAG: hypothetical protein ABII18_02110 [bacterium]
MSDSLRRLIIKLTILFFIITLFPSVAHAGVFPSHLKYYTLKTDHFYIHFPQGIGPIADEIRTISEEAYTNLTARMGWKPWGRTHVVLTDTRDEANGMATVLPYNYILLYISPPDADSSLDSYKDYFRLLFNHEFSHILHIDKHYRFASPFRWVFGRVVAPNGATPGWMREGMSVYEETRLADGFGRGTADYSMMILRSSYHENDFPRIDQIAGLSKHFPGGLGPYLYGGVFFEWLAKTYGEDRMYQYQKEYASGLWLFSLNNKARRVYSKSFYKLYNEFKAYYAQIFEQQKQQLAALGITTMNDVIKTKDSQSYYTPHPDGHGYAYYNANQDEASAITIKLKDETEPHLIKRQLFGQMSFSRTGRYLAFSTLSAVERKTALAEVYYYDTKKKTLHRVYDKEHSKKSMRAKDPAFSPEDNGQRWMVMVRNFLNTDQLYVYDLYGKKGYVITDAPDKTQFSNPRFSPDGSKIVVSEFNPHTGFRDIVIYSKTGKRLAQVTNDRQPDNHPVFASDGHSIYFDSYRTGIANIYRYNQHNGALSQVTNVLDGVFEPMPSPNGRDVYVKRFNAKKKYIQKFTPNITPVPGLVHLQTKTAQNNDTLNKQQIVASTRNYSISQAPNASEIVLVSEHLADFDKLPAPKHSIIEDDIPYETIEPKHAQNKYSLFSSSTHLDGFAKNLAQSTVSFSQNPSDHDLLPNILFGGFGNKKSKTDKKQNTEQLTENKEYPSQYKNELSGLPANVSLDTANPEGTKKYHVLPQLLVPRYIMPSLVYFENTLLLGAAIGRSDPLYRHTWTAFANYRSDAPFLGAGGTYFYSRYAPTFFLGGIRYAVDWGDVNNTRFFEQRHQAYTGLAMAYKYHRFNLSYFYEHRSALTNLNVNLINMMPYAGVRFQYTFSKYHQYTNSISQEKGVKFKLAGEWTDEYLASADVNEEIAIRGDLRFYIEMPWSDHQVLAIRTAAGWVWGDQQQFGVYRLGGPFGEGAGASYSSRLFPLRGLSGITYGGDYAVLFSTEYRIPLATNVNWGIGTWPIFLDKIHMALFCDGGDIKYRTEAAELFTRMLVSVGAEVSGDVVVGYGLPLTIRAGYGVILTNRWRLGGLTDATTRMSLRYGSVYFQLGTMF